MLEIYAGKNALKTIREQGFKQELFQHFLGASGGPKWFILFGLDKAIFGRFFKERSTPLNLIGSSAGAFRAACFAQKDPVAAIEKLAKNYSETIYSDKATPQEITEKAIELLDEVFGDSGAEEIISNEIFRAHFIVAKCKGLTACDSRILQGAGLVASYVMNRIDRSLLHHQYQRFIYQSASSDFEFSDPANFKTQRIDFSLDNIKPALLASGSIPMVMEGIRNIPDSPEGMYRDGGIIDYHFDIKLNSKGLTLYPHFNAQPKAGWFDKNLERPVNPENYDNTVLICPSKAFIESLPYKKIPDRTDFTEFDAETRIAYWKEVLARTDELGEDFNNFVAQQDIARIKPFI